MSSFRATKHFLGPLRRPSGFLYKSMVTWITASSVEDSQRIPFGLPSWVLLRVDDWPETDDHQKRTYPRPAHISTVIRVEDVPGGHCYSVAIVINECGIGYC